MAVVDDHLVIEVGDDGKYARQELVSWWEQERLANARVLVAGAGALGNELVKCLTLLGVGHISLVDFDHVERSNLSRAVFMRESDIGRAKSTVIAERAMEMNPDVEVVPYVGDLRAHFGVGRIAEYDIVLGGLDSRLARLRLNANAYRAAVPFVDGAIEGLMGSVRVFVGPDSACYECTLTDRDMEILNVRRACALLTVDEIAMGKVPTTATAASIVAGTQVQEAVKILHGAPGSDSLVGKGVMINGSTHDSYVVAYERDEFCLAHDTQDVASLERIDLDTTVGDLVARAVEQLGDDSYVQFEDEIVLAFECPSCGDASSPVRSSVRFGRDDLVCSACGAGLEPELLNRATVTDDVFAAKTLREIELPTGDLVTLMSGTDAGRREVLVVDCEAQ